MSDKNSILIQSNMNKDRCGNNVTVVHDRKSYDKYISQYFNNQTLTDCLFPIFVLRSYADGTASVASDVLRLFVANSYDIDKENGKVYAVNTYEGARIQIPSDYKIINPAGWQIYPQKRTMVLEDVYRFVCRNLHR